MKPEEQNQTPLEVQSPAPSNEHLDEFEKSIRFLSELPTDRAMKDLAKMRAPESVKRVIEIMALSKMDLIKSLRLMNIRERALQFTVDAYKQRLEAFSGLQDFIQQNPDYDISLTQK